MIALQESNILKILHNESIKYLFVLSSGINLSYLLLIPASGNWDLVLRDFNWAYKACGEKTGIFVLVQIALPGGKNIKIGPIWTKAV